MKGHRSGRADRPSGRCRAGAGLAWRLEPTGRISLLSSTFAIVSAVPVLRDWLVGQRRGVPHAHGLIPGGADQAAAIRTKPDREDGTRVPLEPQDFLARGEFPDS